MCPSGLSRLEMRMEDMRIDPEESLVDDPDALAIAGRPTATSAMP